MLDYTHLPTMKEMATRAFEHLQPLPHGAIVSYETLTHICQADATMLRTRTAILRAGRRLLHEHNKLLVNVKGRGYQVAAPSEHVGEAKRQTKAALRRHRRALSIVVHVEINGLLPEQLNDVLAAQTKNALLLGMTRNINRVRTLPAKQQVELPSGKRIIALLSKKAS